MQSMSAEQPKASSSSRRMPVSDGDQRPPTNECHAAERCQKTHEARRTEAERINATAEQHDAGKQQPGRRCQQAGAAITQGQSNSKQTERMKELIANRHLEVRKARGWQRL